MRTIEEIDAAYSEKVVKLGQLRVIYRDTIKRYELYRTQQEILELEIAALETEGKLVASMPATTSEPEAK